ncbi:MAG: type II toxin-antitoxin system RelE/ParE family toxin [Flavobacterium sp.]
MGCKNLIIKSSASVEIEKSLVYYLKINSKLYSKLKKEIRESLNLIKENPQIFQFRYSTIRVAWLKTFPFGIYYEYDSDDVCVLAFWHTKQDVDSKIKKMKYI